MGAAAPIGPICLHSLCLCAWAPAPGEDPERAPLGPAPPPHGRQSHLSSPRAASAVRSPCRGAPASAHGAGRETGSRKDGGNGP
eukprot:4691984-Pyramimonas_sp.AAC.1